MQKSPLTPLKSVSKNAPIEKKTFSTLDLEAKYELVFDVELAGLKYSDLPKVRNALKIYFTGISLSTEFLNHFLLSSTEILSNLIQHPEKKPTQIFIKVFKSSAHLILNISDNSTCFSNFNAKCKQSLANLQNVHFSENGRGLGFITSHYKEFFYTPKDLSHDRFNHFTILEKRITNDETETYSAKQISNNDKPHIFIIDDDNIFRRLLIKMLSDHYRIDDFNNAQSALDAFQINRPDLVISDLNMPGMDGTDLRRKLSELKHGNSTPFIFLSGEKDASQKFYINELGIDDFLHKPVKKEYLLRVLGRLLSRSKQIHTDIQGKVDDNITSILSPELPSKLGAWNVGLKFQAAEVGGGDFIVHETTKDGSFIVLVDVMGHGLEAKFFSYAYAGYLRSLLKMCPDHNRPDRFLTHLSRLIAQDSFLDNHIMTCQALWLQNDGTITLASAGHPWPIFNGVNGTEKIRVSGPLPGLIGNTSYKPLDLKLSPGERLFIYTDGLVEAEKKQEAVKKSQQELMAQTTQTAALSLTDAVNTIWGSLFSSTHNNAPQDDATLIILEYAKPTE